jgi:hypothetical protein
MRPTTRWWSTSRTCTATLNINPVAPARIREALLPQRARGDQPAHGCWQPPHRARAGGRDPRREHPAASCRWTSSCTAASPGPHEHELAAPVHKGNELRLVQRTARPSSSSPSTRGCAGPRRPNRPAHPRRTGPLRLPGHRGARRESHRHSAPATPAWSPCRLPGGHGQRACCVPGRRRRPDRSAAAAGRRGPHPRARPGGAAGHGATWPPRRLQLHHRRRSRP